MFDQLTPAERRQVLLASRIRFTSEVEAPRRRAIDKMVETVLFAASPDRWSSATDVVNAFEEIGGLRTLRVNNVVDGLTRLVENGRAEVRKEAPQFTYRLLPAATKQIEREFLEGSARLDRVLNKLYKDLIPDKNPQTLAPFFLEFVCDYFSHLGSHWADYLSGGSSLPPIQLETVERLLARKLDKFNVDPALRPGMMRRSIQFLQQTDPDFDYLKFILGQSFYVARLLGIDGKDYLSEET